MKQKYLETGLIVGTHGLNGELRVQPWCDSPEFLAGFKKLYLDDNGKSVDIASSRVHKNILLVKIKGVDTIEIAETFRGKKLYLDRNDVKLPKGSYFQSDIIGCTVFDFQTNEKYGVISEISQTGANDVWHIEKEGKQYLMPSIPDILKKVDIDEGWVFITPIAGLFDDEN